MIGERSYEKKKMWLWLGFFLTTILIIVLAIIMINKAENKDKKVSKMEFVEDFIKNCVTTEKQVSDYSISKADNYFIGSIEENFYDDEENNTFVKAYYKVNGEIYNSDYDIEDPLQIINVNTARITFHEGEIRGDDISSVQRRTLIQTYFTKLSSLDLHDDTVESLKWTMNHPAFKNVTEDMVDIDISSFEHNGVTVDYYRIISDNNGAHGENLYAYYLLKDNIYYIVAIYGGKNKVIEPSVLKDFMPTKVEIR